MLQSGVDHLLHAVKLGSPEVAHFVEAAIDIVETRVYVSTQFADARISITQSRIVYEDARQDCEHIRHGGQSDGKDLAVVHLQSLFYAILLVLPGRFASTRENVPPEGW
jgi:hypothetical protein